MNDRVPIRVQNAALTERQALITGTRWCMSCSRYCRADMGTMRTVSAGAGRIKRQWRCAMCSAGKNRSGFSE